MTTPDKDVIRSYARAVGFDVVRFARAEVSETARREFADFLAKGHHGEMEWLEAKADRRADPRTLWPDARSVILMGMNYGPSRDPRAALAARAQGVISVYAQNRDYHDVVKGRL